MSDRENLVKEEDRKSDYGAINSQDFLGRFKLRDTFNSITLSWENVNVFAPVEKKGFLSSLWSPAKKNRGRPHILTDVSGVAKPGQLIAIMGASGSGKTTLLNALNGRNSNFQVTGDIRINGQAIRSAASLKSISAYVEQESFFIGTLTVYEHLKFQAELRMDRSEGSEYRERKLQEILTELNLKKCENTIIGSRLQNLNGISGGEKRRLAFATELLMNPRLLFCDEPTSGLDSYMGQSIVECMKMLAKNGRTIICTIHQPSSEIFEMFDKLCLLAEGRLAYMGDLMNAENFFNNLGMYLPKNFNPADFYIQKLAINPADKENCEQNVKAICDNFTKSEPYNEIHNEFNDMKTQALNQDINLMLNKIPSYKANSFIQLRWLLWRSFLARKRNPMTGKVTLLQAIMTSIIFGLIYWRQDLTQNSIQNINGVLFLCITNVSFSNMFPVLFTFTPELFIVLKENRNRLYRIFNYFISKLIIEFFGILLIPIIFVAIVYWMSNLNDLLERYLTCTATMVLVANVAVAYGGLISAIAPNVDSALAISGPIVTPLMIFGGTFLNNDSIPVYFLWLKYLSWLGYSNEILTVNQWDGIQHINCVNGTACRFQNGADVLTSLNMKRSNVNLDFILLGVLYGGCRIVTFLILLLKSYSKK